MALGERLLLARTARQLTQQQMAERAGVSRQTLSKLEAGDGSVSLATLIHVLSILGLDKDIEQLAKEDPLGRQLAANALSRPVSRRTGRVS